MTKATEKEQFTYDEILHELKNKNLLAKNSESKFEVWDRVKISRHPERPHSSDYIRNLSEDFVEVFGDRTFRDDPALITGFGTIEGKKFVMMGLEKGKNTENRLRRNFGMAHPEGYRKALRLMHLAEKFQIPVLTFVDTPGAFPGLSAEERGQGWAIAKNLFEMSRLKTPILVVLIGEGCSGGALGIGVGDVIGMLEHSYYSVISPEGCASILWNDASKSSLAASALKMQAEDLIELKVIDEIIKEPEGGAHQDPNVVYQNVKTFVLKHSNRLLEIPIDKLISLRHEKFRMMGKFADLSL